MTTRSSSRKAAAKHQPDRNYDKYQKTSQPAKRRQSQIWASYAPVDVKHGGREGKGNRAAPRLNHVESFELKREPVEGVSKK
jgi:hypothetical protein